MAFTCMHEGDCRACRQSRERIEAAVLNIIIVRLQWSCKPTRRMSSIGAMKAYMVPWTLESQQLEEVYNCKIGINYISHALLSNEDKLALIS